ncbi:ATP-dependent zinc protease [Candidatus Saccharibacteria bacterium]|nr:ATP-dependent zinc protease [Candidatus Saccharibacteria bacterium]
MNQQLEIIGRNLLVDIIGHVSSVPTKVDTGADSSAVWASDVMISKDGILSFCLFDKGSKYYTGEVIKRRAFRVAVVRSSTGHEQIRYKTDMPVKIGARIVRVTFYLADRSHNNFPVLLGRRTLNKKFLVDVSQQVLPSSQRPSRGLYKELLKDPHAFHKKYHLSDNKETV